MGRFYTVFFLRIANGRDSFLSATPKPLNIKAIQKQKKHNIFYLAGIS